MTGNFGHSNNGLYGQVNDKLKKNVYTGAKTSTATVKVDNVNNIISADCNINSTAIEEIINNFEIRVSAVEAKIANIDKIIDQLILVFINDLRREINALKLNLNSEIQRSAEADAQLLTKINECNQKLREVENSINLHISNSNNPHNVTKAQVGLDRVENKALDLTPIEGSTNYITSGGVVDYVKSVSGKIDKIKVNNIEQPIINKTVNITVPTKNSQLENDSDFATKEYVETHGGKIDKIKVNGVEQPIVNKTVDLNIPKSATWGNIDGNIDNQVDLKNKLATKQDKLIAGENITIQNNVISASTGTVDYNELLNLPSINGNTLIGNRTALQLDLAESKDVDKLKEDIAKLTTTKGACMYYDTTGVLDPSELGESYWYMCSDADDPENTVIGGPYNFGTGGGGGDTDVNIEAVNWPKVVADGAECKINVRWTSTKGEQQKPTGKGTINVYVNEKFAFSKKGVAQGLVELDITGYLTAGQSNSIEVKAVDAYGGAATCGDNIESITISLTSNFDGNKIYSDIINYTYTPNGKVTKNVFFYIDGSLYGTQVVTTSGWQETYQISGLTHGDHLLKVYFECEIGGSTVRSNELNYDIIYDAGETTPIIASAFNDLQQEQYIAFNIPYIVYTPGKVKSTINYIINGEVIETLEVDSEPHSWEYKSQESGNFIFKIKCGEVEKSFNITIKEATIDVEAVKANLRLFLTSTGRTNEGEGREIWEYYDEEKGTTIRANLQNFNFVSDGWVKDDDGNTVLRVSGDASVTIPYKPFAEDFRQSGKTLEFEIATHTVMNYETSIMSCMFDNIGFNITPQLAIIKSQQSELLTLYKEDEHVRVSFVVEKLQDNRLIYMYLNGIMCGCCQYPITDSFRQLTPQVISIGSTNAAIDIYNIRIYDNNLTRIQMVTNWIADTQSGSLKKERYLHNDNYNDNGEIIISKLPKDIPYIVWDINPLPQYKGDKRPGNTEYVEVGNNERSFTSTDATYNVQGTSSAVYPVKNIRTKYKKNKDWPATNFSWKNKNGEDIKEFKIREDAIGDNYFTYKVDYASSEGANNVELVRLYNDVCRNNGILNPPQKLDSRIRVGIDGYPIVAFHKNEDGSVEFCTKANFNNDKANESTYGFYAEDPKDYSKPHDESWEITNNTAAEATFKKAITQETFGNAFEIRFPDEDGYSDISKLKPMSEWVCSTDPLQATNNPLPSPKQFTYEVVTRSEDGTYSKKTVTSPEYTHDTAEYRKIKFKAELKDWFNIDSTIFYYIYTHLFLLVDSRAKNAFPTYFVSRVPNDGGDRWFWLPYDMDTAIGINNEGKLVFDYNLEDTDKIGGADVFNGQDSVMWCNLREMFDGEIGQMYSNLRTSGSLLSFDGVENRFEEHQAKWSENIFNEDSYVKYVKVLAETGANYLEMLQGSKAEQRKWWLYNRFKYFDSKYLAGDAKSDFLQFRAYVEAGIEKPNITITPYADIYACASYANAAGAVVSKRAPRGIPVVLENPFSKEESETDQETYIYSSSQLKSVGDLSPFKPDTVDASHAIKLLDLKVGDGSPSYENPHLTSLALGKNVLLKLLDVRNCTVLKQAVDISGCTNIEEVYFDNTQISGLTLPNGGILKKLHLPGTITDLTLRNQTALVDLTLQGTSNLKSIWIENVDPDLYDALALIKLMPDGGRVRLVGISDTVNSVEQIEEFYDELDRMHGTDPYGEYTAKAVVNGKIYINTITYADWVRLSARYSDVLIVANNIICKVTFYNDGAEYNTLNVVQGQPAVRPADPTKPQTEKFYYVFGGWDKKFDNVQTDLDINAIYSEHIRHFTVTFDTQAPFATADPQDVAYGSKATRPEIKGTIPEGVIFIDWFTERECINVYDFDTPITQNITLYGKWEDTRAPIVADLARNTYNSFNYYAEDNIAITAYAVVKTPGEPTSWINIPPVSPFEGTHYIDSSGTYYFWVKDAANYKASKSIVAYNISKSATVGAAIELYENDVLANTNFAVQGTVFKLHINLDKHYDTLVIKVNDAIVENDSNITISDNTNIVVTCQPKVYTVKFNTTDYASKVIIPDQYVVYNNYATQPESQYIEQHILEAWYKESTYETEWKFFEMPIVDDTTLYAKWVRYVEPTEIDIHVTYTSTPIVLNFELSVANGVTVDWGDGSAIEKFNKQGIVSGSHSYASAGDYKIKITCLEGTYSLGDNANATIQPASTITNVKFSYNLNKTNQWAFKDAVNLTELNLTRYMNTIEIGAFYECTGITSLTIPNTIKYINKQAFDKCSGIAGELIIPDSVEILGDDAFQGCSNITKITLSKHLTTLNVRTFQSCISLVEVDVPENIVLFNNGLIFKDCPNLNKLILRSPNLRFEGTAQNFALCLKLKTVGPIGSGCNIEYAWEDEIPDRAFECQSGQSYIKSVIFKDTITRIGNYAFSGASNFNVNNFTLPESVLEIGKQAFMYCSFSGTLQLPSHLQKIGANCFLYCNTISKLIVPESVVEIGNNAFNACQFVSGAYLYNLMSNNKITTYSASWFLQNYASTVIHIRKDINPITAFGEMWNYRSATQKLDYIADL